MRKTDFIPRGSDPRLGERRPLRLEQQARGQSTVGDLEPAAGVGDQDVGALLGDAHQGADLLGATVQGDEAHGLALTLGQQGKPALP